MNAIILCGGLSTRLGEITKSIPKILLPIGDRTVLDWQLEKIKSAGIDSVVLAAGHLHEVLQKEIGGNRNGVAVHYAIEKEKLGTGGAIKNALTQVPKPQEPTLILNGDVLTTVNIPALVDKLKSNSDGIILVTRVDDVATYGTVEYDKEYKIRAFKEKEGVHKPGYINAGVYVFMPQMQTYFPHMNTFSIEYDVFPHVQDLYAHPSDAPWVDVGVPKRLAWARDNWKIFL